MEQQKISEDQAELEFERFVEALIKTRTPLSINGLTLEVDNARGDQEFLQDLANKNDFCALSITCASGVTYQCRGQIVGEPQVNSQNATVAVNLSGPGILTKQ